MFATVGGHSPPRSRRLLDTVGLGDRGDDRYRSYSLGMKQRLGIASALLGDPDLLILDEPANGLDPQGVREMRSLIGRLAGTGRTVLVSSHDLSELEQVCDWLVLIDTGRSLYQGPTQDLLHGVSGGLAVVPQHPDDRTVLRDLLVARGHEVDAQADRLVVGDQRPRPRRAGGDREPDRFRRRHGAGRAQPAAYDPRRPLSLPGARRYTMTRIIHAELLRLVRRRPLAITAAAALLFAVVATLTVFASARTAGTGAPSRRAGTTVANLAASGGGTEAFAVGASFVGFLVFVTIIALIATEFSGGTFRALLLRDPHRLRVIVGKLAGILAGGGGRGGAGRGLHLRHVAARRPDQGRVDRGVVLARQSGRRPAGLRHRPRRRDRMGRLRHHVGGDLPLRTPRPGRRLRLGGPVREHHRRLVDRRLPATSRARCWPRSSRAAPPSWGSDEPCSPPPFTQEWPPPPPSSWCPEGTSPPDANQVRRCGWRRCRTRWCGSPGSR